MELAGLMARLWDCGVPRPDEAVIVQWRRLLEGYPADLIAKAFDEVAKAHVWPDPPKVADVVKFIRPEIERIQAWRRKLITAKLRADLDAKSAAASMPTQGRRYSDLNEAERADFDVRLAAFKADMSSIGDSVQRVRTPTEIRFDEGMQSARQRMLDQMSADPAFADEVSP